MEDESAQVGINKYSTACSMESPKRYPLMGYG